MTVVSRRDVRVQAAIDNWAPRFVAQGIDYNDFQRTTARVQTWDRWLPEWVAVGEMHEELAGAAAAEERAVSAGEAYLRAALCYHFAKFLWFEDEDLHWDVTYRACDVLRRAHSFLDADAERVEIDAADGTIVGNLRRPRGSERPPLVVLLPGLDSTKEEFFAWEEVFLARGLATFALDGPGQGETGRTLPIRHDYEVAASAALDELARRDDLDAERIGTAGVSLGGYYACRAAAFDDRLKAAVAIGGPYNFGECWPRLSVLTRDAFRRHARATRDDAAQRAAARFDLRGVAERIAQPLLVIFGKLDRLIPWQQAVDTAKEAPQGELVLYEDGNHVCNNIPYRYRPLAADWLAERL